MAKKFSAKKRTTKKEHPVTETDLAVRFAKAVDKELGDFVKAVALFGSTAKHTNTVVSDIDILVIVDDVLFEITEEVTLNYRKLLEGLAAKISPRLHINTLKLSNFWEYCRAGDPVIVNMLRDGNALIDRGFFTPAQMLLAQGRIRPTREAIWMYYSRPSNTLRSAKKHLMSATVDLYWAGMDSAHAALMSLGIMPATPEHVPQLLVEHLVKKRKLQSHYPGVLRELYHLQKGILHREIHEIPGEQYEHLWNETLKLVDALRTVVENHPPQP